MTRVQRRRFTGDTEKFVDIPATWTEAECMAGGKLDRRRNYLLINDDVCELVRFSQPCSGCTEDVQTARRVPVCGGGCAECGYTGRRRVETWVPMEVRDVGAR